MTSMLYFNNINYIAFNRSEDNRFQSLRSAVNIRLNVYDEFEINTGRSVNCAMICDQKLIDFLNSFRTCTKVY